MCFDRRGEKPWVNAEKQIEELVKAKPDVAAHVLSHVFDHYNLLEHGGSVGGSWCTEAGHQIIDLGPRAEDAQ